MGVCEKERVDTNTHTLTVSLSAVFSLFHATLVPRSIFALDHFGGSGGSGGAMGRRATTSWPPPRPKEMIARNGRGSVKNHSAIAKSLKGATLLFSSGFIGEWMEKGRREGEWSGVVERSER